MALAPRPVRTLEPGSLRKSVRAPCGHPGFAAGASGAYSREMRKRLRRLRKEKTIYRRLGLSQSATPLDRTGLIIIQIDGLSHDHLLYALEHRRMPFLKKLLTQRGFRLKPFDCGIPASTPAFQTKFMYGLGGLAPGFRWLERHTGKLYNMKSTESAAALESRLQTAGGTASDTHSQDNAAAARSTGLLAGGTSICNFFTGDAVDNFFVTSVMGGSAPATRLSLRDIVVILFVNIGAIVRIAFFSVREALWELLDTLYALVFRVPRRILPLFAIVRVLCNAVLSEIGTVATIVEIERNMPAVYLNFLGYDEMAHHDGPLSRQALATLRSIDRNIRQICKVLERSAVRHYELIVLSDHGQVPTIPYHVVQGEDLRQTILREALEEKVTVPSQHTDPSILHTLSMLNYASAVEPALPRVFGGMFRRIRRWLHKKLLSRIAPETVNDLEGVLVLPTSHMAHVYFGVQPRKLTTEEIAARHPRVFAHLKSNPGIGFIVTGDEEKVEIHSSGGRIIVADRIVLEGENPLHEYRDVTRTARYLAELYRIPDSGDIIVFGARTDEDRVVNFLNQYAGHGGVEPGELSAFVVYPGHIASRLGDFRTPEELYRALCAIRGI